MAAIAVVVVSVACEDVSDTRTESQTVEAGSATSALVRVEMGAGTLRVDGGSSALLDADFTYNVDGWKPQVDYEVVDGRGEARGRQIGDGDVNIFDSDDVVYRWKLNLSDDVPTELDVEMGAGKSTLELGGTGVTNIDVSAGAGSTTIDLTGDWEHDLRGKIETGAGRVTVKVPKDVGVRIDVDRGVADIDRIGFDKDGDAYENAAYGTTDVSIDLELEAGAGDINLEVVE